MLELTSFISELISIFKNRKTEGAYGNTFMWHYTFFQI